MAKSKPVKRSRPVIEIQWDPFAVFLVVLGVIGAGILIGSLFYFWPDLPPRIPTHFGSGGIPDQWGGRTTLILIAVLGVILFAGMVLMSRFPQKFNYPWAITEENAKTQYQIGVNLVLAMGTVITWLFAYMNLMTIQTALGKANGLGSWFGPATVVLTLVPVAIGMLAMRKAR